MKNQKLFYILRKSSEVLNEKINENNLDIIVNNYLKPYFHKNISKSISYLQKQELVAEDLELTWK